VRSEFYSLYAHVLYRKNNTLVLSKELEEDAVKILVDIALKDLFPESCDKWRTAKQEIRARCKEELEKKEDTVRQEIARGECLLRGTLHEAVMKDVIILFPYDFVTFSKVFGSCIANAPAYCRSLERDRLSLQARANDDLSTNQEASGIKSASL